VGTRAEAGCLQRAPAWYDRGITERAMLRIRQQQYDVFSRVALEGFLDRAADFVEENWEDEFQEAGREQVREAVAAMLERCRAFGIEAEGHVLRFINISYALGIGFEGSAEYPWALAVLEDGDRDAEDRIEELEEKTEAVFEAS